MNRFKEKLPNRIAITLGEPAGIGPDLIIQIAQIGLPCELVVIADPDLLQQRAQHLKLPLQIIEYDPKQLPQLKNPGQIVVLPVFLAEVSQCGKLNANNSPYVINAIERAVKGCLAQEFSALVTGPVHKEIINAAGIEFSGHTEFLATLTNKAVVMMLLNHNLRVALVTTHLPLSEVPRTITSELLTKTITIVYNELQKKFAIADPKILVCGLNPHAGENGYLGREEIEIIIPTLEKLRAEKINIIGPLPADTAFLPKNLQQADVVLTMYHDQGLPVLKHIGFDNAVNITLGLPFVRTSVDHGTALELAGTGKASDQSFHAAIDLADSLLNKKYE